MVTHYKIWAICGNTIHQFDISGLSFATGSGRELGVKELCQLYVYNSIVRVKQSSVFEIRQKFLRFLKVLLSLRDMISRSSFFKTLVYVLLVQTTDAATFALCFVQVKNIRIQCCRPQTNSIFFFCPVILNLERIWQVLTFNNESLITSGSH